MADRFREEKEIRRELRTECFLCHFLCHSFEEDDLHVLENKTLTKEATSGQGIRLTVLWLPTWSGFYSQAAIPYKHEVAGSIPAAPTIKSIV
jgi:hypothetical protein